VRLVFEIPLFMHIAIRDNYIYFYYAALVSFGKVTPEQREEVEKFGLKIYSWDEFLQLVGYFI
jgi:hypothetical protein